MVAIEYNYYGDLLYIYDLEKNILIKEFDKTNTNIDLFLKKNPMYVLCFKIKKKEDFMYTDFNICFEKFPWKTYYKINKELVSTSTNNNNKRAAWHHWINYGIKERRAFSFINNTHDHRARIGNLFFLNMCLHLFSIKYNLKSSYKYETEFKELGITFYKGTNIYTKNLLLTEYNFENVLESDVSPKNIIINNNVWFHTHKFCNIINNYFVDNKLFEKVANKNKFKDRYGNNNSLFIHVRLGDVSDRTSDLLSYYETAIQRVDYNKGYIASDNINHNMCKFLIDKYKLMVVDKNEVNTIMFAITCSNIILSGGTFSWLIGFLAYKSKQIIYPDIKKKWYGDIFRFKNWCKI